jgi:hypothetical protein
MCRASARRNSEKCKGSQTLFLRQLFHQVPMDILDIHESLSFEPSGGDQFFSLSGGFPSPGKVHHLIVSGLQTVPRLLPILFFW